MPLIIFVVSLIVIVGMTTDKLASIKYDIAMEHMWFTENIPRSKCHFDIVFKDIPKPISAPVATTKS